MLDLRAAPTVTRSRALAGQRGEVQVAPRRADRVHAHRHRRRREVLRRAPRRPPRAPRPWRPGRPRPRGRSRSRRPPARGPSRASRPGAAGTTRQARRRGTDGTLATPRGRRVESRRMTAERDLDVVLYGATGFVGRLTARYLAEHAPEGARIGARRPQRGQARRSCAASSARAPPTGRCSSPTPQDAAALAAMAQRARAVATTVGPYQQYGFPLVQACAEAGTHYADLTGEVLFMRETIDRFDAAARETRRADRALVRVRLDPLRPRRAGAAPRGAARRRRRARGHDVRARARAAAASAAARWTPCAASSTRCGATPPCARSPADPYALSPDRAAEPDLGKERELQSVERDAELGWLAPFVMAGDQHARRAPQQRAAEPRLRPPLPLPRGDERGLAARSPRSRRGAIVAALGGARRRHELRPDAASCSTASSPPPARARARRPSAAASTRSRSTRARAPAARYTSRVVAARATPATPRRRCCSARARCAWRSTPTGCPRAAAC